MKWSALKKRLMALLCEGLDVEIHLTSLVNAKNQGAHTHLGLTLTLACLDRRVGKRSLRVLSDQNTPDAVRSIIDMRLA